MGISTTFSGIPEENAHQLVIFIEEPNTWQLEPRQWRPSPTAPPPKLLEGAVDEEVWSTFCEEMQRLVPRFWTDGLYLGLGLPLVTFMAAILPKLGVVTVDGTLLVGLAVAGCVSVVGVVKWLNDQLDEQIGVLVGWLCDFITTDAVDVTYDLGWTGYMKPPGVKSWRAVVITKGTSTSRETWATRVGLPRFDEDDV